MLIFGFSSLCTLRRYWSNNMTKRYKTFTFIMTIIFYLYNTINIHKCTLNSIDFLMSSSSSNLCFFSPLLSPLSN